MGSEMCIRDRFGAACSLVVSRVLPGTPADDTIFLLGGMGAVGAGIVGAPMTMIFLVLEATIGVSKQGEKSQDKTSLVSTMSTNPDFKMNDQDMKFLKSLRIKIEEDKHDKDK